MKQQVWILNSSLLLFFITTLIISNLLEQGAIKLKIKPTIKLEDLQKKKLAPFINLEKIIKNDLFDTFIESIEPGPTKKSLITPIPSPQVAPIIPPPTPKKQKFVNPLPVKLKGIVFSSDDIKSLAMIEDETQKEGLYHLGEKIKDAQVIKIAKNNIVLLRANGQLEILSLRKEDDLLKGLTPTQPQEKWKYSIKKIDDFNFDIDPTEFRKESPALSELIEELSIGTAYEQGTPIGIKIGKINPKEIGFVLGLKPNDIIKSINNLSTIDIKDRMKIYDEVTKLQKGNTIQVNLQRNNIDSAINYTLKKLDKPKKLTFISPGINQTTQSGLPQSKTQQQQQSISDFQKQHNVDARRQQTIADIRKRLLNKLRQRSPNVRVR